MPLSPAEPSSPEEALERCHVDIREGHFSAAILKRVRKHQPRWETLPAQQKHQGAVVASEVYDYYAMHDDASRALQDYNLDDMLSALKSGERYRSPTLKREVWIVLSLAQAHYRSENYTKVRSVLSDCVGVLDAADPARERYLGTRARLTHLSGQVHRQLGAYDEAVRQFGESIEYAWRRFRQKTDFREFIGPEKYAPSAMSPEIQDREFHHARKLANWTIARSLALGIAWVYYVTGRLSDASRCLAVGATLFRSTHDSVHRAYCELLSGAVERARHADKPERLDSALKCMRVASTGLVDHPLFRLRAGYEVALAHLHAGDTAAAEKEIAQLERHLLPRQPTARTSAGRGSRQPSDGGRSLRWQSQVQALRSRLCRARKDYTQAADRAADALRFAERAQQPTLRAEALIAWAEAECESGSDAELEHALGRLAEARSLSRENPKIGAVCSLHTARVHLKRGRQDEARDAFRRWDLEYHAIVEHGFVRRLSDQVRAQLWSSDGELPLDGLEYDHNARRLKKLLVEKVLRIPNQDRPSQARLLGLKNERDLQRWIKECNLTYMLKNKQNSKTTP